MANVAAFHTQQAAEKLLKALIAMAGIEPPRVHDLAELNDLVAGVAPDAGRLSESIETITSWAILTRYPTHGDTPPPTLAEVADALALVKQLRAFVVEKVRGDAHTNTIEGFFSVFKRGMKGIYQHCGENHLHRYPAECDFRYGNRQKLGVNDAERADRALKGFVGKRLTYKAAGG